MVTVLVLVPEGPFTVKETEYFPEDVYRCFGFCIVLVPPSPKDQDQLLIVPVERSLNWTVKGALPLTGVATKSATGGRIGPEVAVM